jgi:hypothetical protein
MAFHYGFTGDYICILGDLFGIKKSKFGIKRPKTLQPKL